MEFNTILTQPERKIVRKIARLQIQILNELLRRDSSEDVTLFCLEENLSEEQMDDALVTEIQVYRDLKDDPASFLKLDDEQLSIFKHNLENFITGKSKKYTYRIWRKLDINDKFLHHPN